MIKNLIFAEPARAQFDTLSKRQKAEAGSALLAVAQEASRAGVWRSEGKKPLSVSYEVSYPDNLVVTGITADCVAEGAAGPAKRRQPYQGMEMRCDRRGEWMHLNPHEE